MIYLAYIDGLRAVAILLVLFFHAGIKLFPSGFIGVDIFFVISGFLITSIIFTSLGRDKFSFARFYSRRLWRLQPVFICLLVVTTIAALIYCLPEDLVPYAKSLRKTSLYKSNIYFSRLTTGYFAPDGKTLPLLHTWSLSIEWQCYLILPLILFLLYRGFSEERQRTVIYLLTGLSFLLAIYASLYHTAYSYYLLSSRIFEFLIGSCVALNNSRSLFNNKIFLNVITLLALGSLVYIATIEGVALGFPNVYAFIVCIATAVLIKVGNNSAASSVFALRLLSLNVLVFIGLISYSLYIWHWPLFAFSRYLGVEESPFMLIVLLGITFLVAYCSWRFIEKPARNFSSIPFFHTVIILLLVPILLIRIGAHEIKKQKGFPERFSYMDSIFSEVKKYHSNQRVACLVFKETEVSKDCVVGVKNRNSKTGLMIGDSFSNHYWKFIEQFAEQAEASIFVHGMASCLVLPGINQTDFLTKKSIYNECRKQTMRYYEMIKNNHYDYVFIGENWAHYIKILLTEKGAALPEMLAKKQMSDALDRALQLIVDAGSKPVLIKATSISPKGDPYLCIVKYLRRRIYHPADCDYVQEQEKWLDKIFVRMEKKYPQLIILDPKKILCSNEMCKAEVNNVPAFRDWTHLTDYASYHLGKAYLERYKNPLIG